MKLSLHESVNAPIDQVFNAYADFRSAAERIDSILDIEILTEGPIGKGTRFRETRTMFGRASTEEMEITDFIPGKMYVVEADSCGSRMRSVFLFEVNGNRTDVNVELTAKAQTLFAKLMWPVGMMMSGPLKKAIQSDINQIKVYCEQNRQRPD